MHNYRFILEPYKSPSSRYTCPSCGKHKQFTRYIDTETNEHLSSEVGKCNRDINCGYHYNPKQYFQDNPHLNHSVIPSNARDLYFNSTSSKIRNESGCSSLSPLGKDLDRGQRTTQIPIHLFQQSLKSYHQNNFITFLQNLFGEEITSTLISKYYIGTSKHWNGSTVFWQIDKNQNIRTGKIMLYNPATGKRVKQPFNHITWVHTLMNKNRHCEPRLLGGEAISQTEHNSGCSSLSPSGKDLDRGQVRTCLFGEHLLKDTTKSIAIVESEKTAIIASVYFPNLIWLACGSLTNLTKEKCEVLSERKVILFPDLKCFDKWNEKAKELSSIANFTVSDLLEKNATDTDKQSGLDLADYLIRFNHASFVMPRNEASVLQAGHPEPVEGYSVANRLCEPRPLGGETISPSEPLHPLIEKIISQAPNSLDHFEFSTPKPITELAVKVFPQLGKDLDRGDWSPLINDLQSFFSSTPLPTTPIKLNNHSTITDVSKFIEGHMAVVKANNGNKAYLPYLERVNSLKEGLLRAAI